MPTDRSASTAFFFASALPMSLCAWIASMIWSPILWTGLNEDIGSWKTIAIRSPRIASSSSLLAVVSSLPW